MSTLKNKCDINWKNGKKNCRSCRFNKCLNVGLIINEKYINIGQNVEKENLEQNSILSRKFSNKQTKLLCESLEKNSYPTRETIQKFAHDFEREQSSIETWFKTKRMYIRNSVGFKQDIKMNNLNENNLNILTNSTDWAKSFYSTENIIHDNIRLQYDNFTNYKLNHYDKSDTFLEQICTSSNSKFKTPQIFKGEIFFNNFNVLHIAIFL
jgi:hypothetical protein